jgi:membrane protein YqaA with SNARE-associated domain
MTSDFIEWGYWGLFIASFLAATILPLSSELVLTALIAGGLSVPWLLAVATIGNVLGSLTNYALGYFAKLDLIKRWLRMSDHDMRMAQQRFAKYGSLCLCFSWVPIIGDPLTLIAGVLRMHVLWFLVLVAPFKFMRYVLVSQLVT